jgi:hypothetical protein
MLTKRIVVDVPPTTFERLKRLKEDDGYKARTWGDWLTFKSKDISPKASAEERASGRGLMGLWCTNFAHNLTDILEGDSISKLVPEHPEIVPKGPSIVVGSGPSIHMHKHLDLLQSAIDHKEYHGLICACDSMLIPLLERGIIPDLTATVDGQTIITKWYDHPLVEKYGSQIKTCLVNSVNPDVVKICKKNKVQIYWFDGMMDGLQSSESWTRLQNLMTVSHQNPNGIPAVSCGGNVGCTIWVLNHTLLRRSPIALIGIDLGYPDGTKFQDTPYFSMWIRHCDSYTASQMYKKTYNPCFKTYAYADKVFQTYRAGWLTLARKVPAWFETFNCSEEGTLFGPGITCMPFHEWLEKVKNLKMPNIVEGQV